jgi:AraC family transcriptional regulator
MNFTEKFTDDVFYSCFNSDEYLLDFPELRDRKPVNFFQKLYPNDDVVRFYVRELRNLSSVHFPDQNRINEVMHCILEYVFRLQLNLSKEADTINSAKRSTRYELYKRLNIAKDYINSNFSEPVNLEKLSSVSCMCQHHLLRKFKSHFGITPHQYLTNVRLESAKNQIESGTASITEICFNAGYESLSSFSDLFKKRYKNSPETHRKSHHKKSIFK